MDIRKQVTLEDDPADVAFDTPHGPATFTVAPFNGPGIYTVTCITWDEEPMVEVDGWPFGCVTIPESGHYYIG